MKREILDRAFEKAADGKFPTTLGSIHPNELERFANNIIEEALQILFACYKAQSNDPVYKAMLAVEEHFGVGDSAPKEVEHG